MTDKDQIRDAATIILLRTLDDQPHVLMGQRGRAAAFMPDKFVFPGGAVDEQDHGLVDEAALPPTCLTRLRYEAPQDLPTALVAAGIRELWEETGLALAQDGCDFASAPPPDWQAFASAGHLPAAHAMRFAFRAITPPGRPRRFDARFFVAQADDLVGDPDDFTGASGELSHLQWVRLDRTRALALPFITEVVLAEVEAQLRLARRDAPVPFFDNRQKTSAFRSIA